MNDRHSLQKIGNMIYITRILLTLRHVWVLVKEKFLEMVVVIAGMELNHDYKKVSTKNFKLVGLLGRGINLPIN